MMSSESNSIFSIISLVLLVCLFLCSLPHFNQNVRPVFCSNSHIIFQAEREQGLVVCLSCVLLLKRKNEPGGLSFDLSLVYGCSLRSLLFFTLNSS